MNKSQLQQSSGKKVEQELIDLKTRFAEYQKDNRKLKSKNDSLSKSLISAKESTDRLQKENSALQAQIRQLQDANRKLDNKSFIGVKKASNIIKLESAISKLKEKNSEQQQKILELEEMKNNQAKEIQVLNTALDDQQWDGITDEKLVYEVSTLRVDCENLANELNQKNEENAILHQALQDVSEEKNDLQIQYEQIYTELEEKRQLAEDLEDQCNNLEAERSDSQEEKETLLQVIQEKTAEIIKLRNREDQLTRDNEQAKVQSQDTSQRLEQCMHELQTFRDRCNELSHLYSMKEAQFNEEYNRRMYLQQVEAELRARLNELLLQNQNLSSQLDAFNELNLNYQSQLSEKDDEKLNVVDENSQLKQKMKQLQESLDTVEGRRDKIQDEIVRELTSFKEQFSRSEEERLKLKGLYEKSSQRADNLAEQIGQLQKDHGQLSERYIRIEESKKLMQQTLIDQLNNERANVKDKERKIDDLNSQILKLTEDNTRIQSLVEAKEQQKEVAKTKKKILKKIAKKRDQRTPDSSSINDSAISVATDLLTTSSREYDYPLYNSLQI